MCAQADDFFCSLRKAIKAQVSNELAMANAQQLITKATGAFTAASRLWNPTLLTAFADRIRPVQRNATPSAFLVQVLRSAARKR